MTDTEKNIFRKNICTQTKNEVCIKFDLWTSHRRMWGTPTQNLDCWLGEYRYKKLLHIVKRLQRRIKIVGKCDKIKKKIWPIILLFLGSILFVEGITSDLHFNAFHIQNNTTDTAAYLEAINAIIEKSTDEISAFLDKYPVALRWIEISGYDFTKDGTMEIILSYEYVENTAIISYNNVFDHCGKLLFQFVSSDIRDMEICVEENAQKYYIQTELHIAAHHDVTLYEEISYKKNWNMAFMFAEWDCRDGQKRNENQKEGYAIYECFSTNETEAILEIGYENMVHIFQVKDANGTIEQLEEYEQCHDKQPKEHVTLLGTIYPKKEDINWISADLPLDCNV
ncbi:MAG: hypothetical protein HFH79_12860 [Lachnospiraceae bacterium]|nr:hypothetical protein [Lachnospiraceae bacterium]MCI8974456.1 hypothetical protein [Lachnospiraceae bacterium]